MPGNDEIFARLGRIEKALDVLALKDTVSLEARADAKTEASAETAALKARIAALESEKNTLSARVKELAEGRIQARPEQVADGFRKAIDALQVGLAPRPGDRTAYTVSDMQVTLKALVALEADGGLRFVLPTPDERFESAQLSEVRFHFKQSSEAAAPMPNLLPVPSLLGLPRPAAEVALQRAGLRLGTVQGAESRYAVDTVIGQSPDPGDEVAADVPIDIVVAIAVKPTVPDLRGLPLDEAQAHMELLGFSRGGVERRETTKAPAGVVLTHDPKAGMRVEAGAPIALVVAVAPPPTVRVPELAQLTKAEAEARLKAARLAVGKVVEREGGRPGTILEQDHAAGAELSPGTPIALVVAADVPVEKLIERAVKHAASSRAGISGRLLGERLRALDIKDYAAFEALANASPEELQKAIAAPTPRGLQDAGAALKKALQAGANATPR